MHTFKPKTGNISLLMRICRYTPQKNRFSPQSHVDLFRQHTHLFTLYCHRFFALRTHMLLVTAKSCVQGSFRSNHTYIQMSTHKSKYIHIPPHKPSNIAYGGRKKCKIYIFSKSLAIATDYHQDGPALQLYT